MRKMMEAYYGVNKQDMFVGLFGCRTEGWM